MKHDNSSPYYEDWTTDKLRKYTMSLWDCIYGVNFCYGVWDILMLDGCIKELENRGYKVCEDMKVIKVV